MILRSFFSKYGVVTGVSMIGLTPGKLLRYVVSFKVRPSHGSLAYIAALYCLLSRLGSQPGHGPDRFLGEDPVLHRLGEGGYQSDHPSQHQEDCQV